MAYYLPSSSVVNNISHDRAYNANYDIVWSFEYSMSGIPDVSQGSFTAFLYDGTVPTLTGGAPGKGGAYSPLSAAIPTTTQFYDGLSGAVIAVNFDTTGLFAVSGDGVDGNETPTLSSISIRGGSTGYELLTSVAISSRAVHVPLTLSAVDYNRLRFHLTDIGQTIKVYYSTQNQKYEEVLSFATGLSISDSTTYKVGVGFAAPVSGTGSLSSKFSIKNYHVEGVYATPTSEVLELTAGSFETYSVSGATGTATPSANIVSRLAKITLYDCPTDPVIPLDDPEPCSVMYTDLSATEEVVVVPAPTFTGLFVNVLSADRRITTTTTTTTTTEAPYAPMYVPTSFMADHVESFP